MAMSDAVLARLLVDDQSKIGFMSFQRNAERSRKVAAAFREQGVDQIVSALDKQVRAMRLSSKELDLYNAAVLGATDAQIQQINKAYDAIDAIQAQAAEQERLVQEQQDAQRQSDQLTSAIDRKIQALRDEAATLDMTEDEIEQYKLAQMGATQAQIDAVMAERSRVAALKKTQKETTDSTKGLRLMRGGLGQLGHQVQDVAVQLQMGTNAMLVFGQQGSQVASLFGQRGALVGAVLAVGAAIATYLFPKISKTKTALEELEESVKSASSIMKVDFINSTANLAEEFTELAKESERFANASLRQALVTSLNQSKDAMESLNETMAGIFVSDVDIALKGISDELGTVASRFGITRDEAKKLRDLYYALKTGTDGAAEAIQDYVTQIQEGIDPQKGFNAQLTKLDESIQGHVHQITRAEKIQKLYKDALEGTVPALEEAKKKEEETKAVKDRGNDALETFLHNMESELILL